MEEVITTFSALGQQTNIQDLTGALTPPWGCANVFSFILSVTQCMHLFLLQAELGKGWIALLKVMAGRLEHLHSGKYHHTPQVHQ